MVRRKKTTIFLDAKETTPVLEIKKMISGITKVAVENQKLYYNIDLMEDHKCLNDYGLNTNTAKAQSPATIRLVYRDTNKDNLDKFEKLDITPLSTPPELPDVMKSPEGGPNSNDGN